MSMIEYPFARYHEHIHLKDIHVQLYEKEKFKWKLHWIITIHDTTLQVYYKEFWNEKKKFIGKFN